MAGDVFIYAEHEEGAPKRTALELATKAAEIARSIGTRVGAVALGSGASATAERLGQHGVEIVYVSEEADFDEYLTEPHVDMLAHLVEEYKPATLLIADTLDGRDIGARLAARLDAGLVSAVVDLVPRDGHIDAKETIFGGNYITTVESRDSSISIFLVRPNAFPPTADPKTASVEQIAYSVPDAVRRARKGAKTQEEGAPTPLEEASIIVSGGRGLGGPDPFALLDDLAKVLGGVVGASRAAVDAGWIPYSHQVGQTGRTVKPQLYIAIGISGAVQHRVGMQTADTIVAINRDGDAPIFGLADLGVVGDLFQIVPALTDEVKKRKGE